jgi:hypothetical protein
MHNKNKLRVPNMTVESLMQIYIQKQITVNKPLLYVNKGV